MPKIREMKKTFFPAFMLTIMVSTAAAQQWEKSGDRMWQGPIQKYYKLDENCQLMTSIDGTSWSVSTEGSWQDDQGSWYKIDSGKLHASADGITWKPAEDKRWLGSDGHSYKLEDNCKLMVMKNTVLGKKTTIEKERNEYREKLNQRLRKIENKIAELRLKARQDTSLNTDLHKVMSARTELEARLREAGDKAEAKWEEFKRDTDSFLERNKAE